MKSFFEEKFNRLMFLSIFMLLILIGLFAYLNLNGTTHVRFVDVAGGETTAEITGQRIQVYFSGPMNKDSSAQFLSLSPAATFSTAWSNNTLFIILKQNLLSNTKYTLTVNGSIKDIYGQALGKNYNFDFNTQGLTLAFIENINNTKEIVETDQTFQNQKVLYTSPDIKLFAMNKDYLAVVTENNQLNDLLLINLSNNVTTDFNIDSSVISRIDFSPTDNQFVYLVQKVQRENNYVQAEGNTSVNLYNIDLSTNKLLNIDQQAFEVIDLKYSPDGTNIVIKMSDGNYKLAQVSDFTNQTQLGKFLALGGFSNAGDKIIFVAFDPLNTYTESQYLIQYNSDRTQTQITNGDFPVLDPQYFHNEDSLIYAEKYRDLESTKGIFKIVKLDSNKNVSVILTDENNSLELPKPSPDDRYIAIERYTPDQLSNFDKQRDYLFQTKPADATLVIWDTNENKLIDQGISGIEAKWIN